jgi:hypothetical protein
MVAIIVRPPPACVSPPGRRRRAPPSRPGSRSPGAWPPPPTGRVLWGPDRDFEGRGTRRRTHTGHRSSLGTLARDTPRPPRGAGPPPGATRQTTERGTVGSGKDGRRSAREGPEPSPWVRAQTGMAAPGGGRDPARSGGHRPRRRLGRQPERAEQAPHGVGLGHRAHNPARAGTAGTDEDLGREHAVEEKARPSQARAPGAGPSSRPRAPLSIPHQPRRPPAGLTPPRSRLRAGTRPPRAPA